MRCIAIVPDSFVLKLFSSGRVGKGPVRSLVFPQAQEQDGELSRHSHDGPFLCAPGPISGQHETICAQGALGAEGSQDVLRGTHQEPAQVGVAPLGDAQLRIVLPALVAARA